MRHEDGAIIIGSTQVASTRQCGHCAKHFQIIPGSGRERGFCLKCSRITCGSRTCLACIPIEARLEHYEGKKTPYDDVIKDLLAKGATIL